ncbi:helix-turn-helix domain-containing protein [Janthinobacterium sp. PC23-8]|uniref:helix-turn-helix domain-containing protein n=1 Tax=Janthinobacterium sp. PC23-8 TaxID=2012679 RepID=UPI000B96FF9B|nr:hypothetical protein CD932_22585 [Janthinobacterium sp. PC23-8]
MKSTPQTEVARACGIVGSQAALAKILCVSPAVVNQWIKGIRPIPDKQCPKIEIATSGAVRCETLCPDFDWAYLRASQSKERESPRRATDPVPDPGHAGRQPPSPSNILDTVPRHSVVLPALPPSTEAKEKP